MKAMRDPGQASYQDVPEFPPATSAALVRFDLVPPA